jgi:hypothetical protein
MRLIGLAVVILLNLAVEPLAAEAQVAGEVARIGYLSPNPAANPHLQEP